MTASWIYVTLSVLVALIMLGLVSINTAIQRYEENEKSVASSSPNFVRATLAAIRWSEDVKALSARDGAEFNPVTTKLIDKSPKLNGILADADRRYDIWSKCDVNVQSQCGAIIDAAAQVDISEQEANKLISIWKPYFIPKGIDVVDQLISDDKIAKFHYVRMQVNDKFYMITITIAYKQ